MPIYLQENKYLAPNKHNPILQEASQEFIA
jgi:hypothetical protein